jgi:hypothetical protein
MAVGWSTATANAILDATFRGEAYSYPAVWLKLHVGDPGPNGTANPASETTRKNVTAAIASGGANTSTVLLQWTNVPASETFTHATFWDDSAAGNFILSAGVTANPVTAGQTFELPIGDIDASIPVAS